MDKRFIAGEFGTDRFGIAVFRAKKLRRDGIEKWGKIDILKKISEAKLI